MKATARQVIPLLPCRPQLASQPHCLCVCNFAAASHLLAAVTYLFRLRLFRLFSFPLFICYIVEHLTFFSLALDIQFQNYIVDMRSYDVFLELKGIDELARKMVETQKDVIYLLVYLLVKLVLTLLIATATIERSFSTMKYIKNQLRN